MNMSAAIRYRREAAGLTQAELGAAIGTERFYVSKLEADGYMPSIRTVMRIAHALGITASQLVRDAEKRAK